MPKAEDYPGSSVGIFIAATGLCNVKLVALSGSGFLALGDVMNGEVGLFTHNSCSDSGFYC